MAESFPPLNQLDSNSNPIPGGPAQWNMRASKEGGSNIVYVAYAKPGTADTEPKWMIAKHTYDASNDIIATNFALGSNRFQNVWDDSSAATITGATQADPCAITAANSFSDGDIIEITGVVGMTELNGNFYEVDDATGSGFTLNDLDGANVNSTGYGAYSSGGEANARNFANYSYS